MQLNASFRPPPLQDTRFAYLQWAHCVVCDAVLPHRFSNGVQAHDRYPSCQAVACRMVVSRREEIGEAGFRHYLQMQARHKQHLAAVAQAVAARKSAEVEENAQGWFALRARLPAAPALETLSLLLPSGPRRASRVTADSSGSPSVASQTRRTGAAKAASSAPAISDRPSKDASSLRPPNRRPAPAARTMASKCVLSLSAMPSRAYLART